MDGLGRSQWTVAIPFLIGCLFLFISSAFSDKLPMYMAAIWCALTSITLGILHIIKELYFLRIKK
jgi:hypothetical protein